MAEREHVRARPWDVPRELAGRIDCEVCDTVASVGSAYIVHLDAYVNDKGETKAGSYFACCDTCCDTLIKALHVEFAFVGAKAVRDGG